MIKFVFPGPDGDEETLCDVTVTSLSGDGEYSIRSAAGREIVGIKPGFGQLVDDAGNLVQPTLPQATAITPDVLVALQILLGGGIDG